MAEAKSEEKCQASFRVKYWAGTGRAHPLRLALTLGGLAFEDEFVDGAEHKAAKISGTRRWSGLPELVVLDDDGKESTVIGQSLAQTRYVAKLTGLYPSNILQAAFVDEILDSYGDAMQVLSFKGEKDKAKQKTMRQAVIAKDGALSYWLNKFISRLQENEKRGHSNGFIVGDSLTIADLKLATGLSTLTSGFWDHIPKDYLSENHPRLQVYMDTINKNQIIAEFNSRYRQRLADFKDDAKKKSVKVVTYGGRKVAGVVGVAVSRAVCILNADGGSGVTGQVIFEAVGGKTKISAEIHGLSAGKHGFHIHELGDLSGGCKTAKGHYNPYNKTHGGPKDARRHVGDLGNIIANDKGVANCEIIDELVQLNGLNSVVGRSVVVHADEDDLGKGGFNDSLTTGHAGARVACGVIGRGN
jgi:Cu-Zn family superoxide dismutase